MEAVNCLMHGAVGNDPSRLNPTNPVFAVGHHFRIQQVKNFGMEMKLFLPKAERCFTSHDTLLFVKFTKHKESSFDIGFLYPPGIKQLWNQITVKDIGKQRKTPKGMFPSKITGPFPFLKVVWVYT